MKRASLGVRIYISWVSQGLLIFVDVAPVCYGDDCRNSAKDQGEKQEDDESEERVVVLNTDTIIDPGAVVIKPVDAAITYGTMF